MDERVGTDEDAESRADGATDEAFVEAEREHRLAKLDALRERGIEPYPVRFDRDRHVAELHERVRRPRRRAAETDERGQASPAA